MYKKCIKISSSSIIFTNELNDVVIIFIIIYLILYSTIIGWLSTIYKTDICLWLQKYMVCKIKIKTASLKMLINLNACLSR